MKKNLIIFFILCLGYSIGIYLYLFCTNFQIEPYSSDSLAIVKNWELIGIQGAQFTPIKSIDPQIYGLSHPPFSYYFLFGFGKIISSQYYFYCNLFLTLLSATIIYLTVSLLSHKHPKKEISVFGIIGVLIYLSHPITLKYQVLNFHPDIFVQPFLLLAVYIILKVLMKNRYRSLKYFLFYSLALITMCYSSWFGVIFSLIILLFGLFNLRRGYRFFPFLILTAMILVGVTFLVYLQYAYVGGWKTVLLYFKDTYIQESFLVGGVKRSSIQIILHMIKSIGNLLIILVLLIGGAILKRRRKFVFTKNGYRYLFISILPVVLYSILFIHYFQNIYSSLYLLAPLVVAVTIWLEKIYTFPAQMPLLSRIIGIIVVSNLFLFAVYEHILGI